MNKYRVVDGGEPPVRAHSTDAGYDIATRVDATLEPGETVYIPSGVAFDLDPDYCVIVMPRSSSFRFNVTVTPTLIDCGYTGEISTVATNTSHEKVFIKAGTRLAQCKLDKVYLFDNDTEIFRCGDRQRGEGRFGSSDAEIVI